MLLVDNGMELSCPAVVLFASPRGLPGQSWQDETSISSTVRHIPGGAVDGN